MRINDSGEPLPILWELISTEGAATPEGPERERLRAMARRGEIVLGRGGMPEGFWDTPMPEDPEEFLEVSEADLIAEIDREARQRLDMSFEEFTEAYREGVLPDSLAVNELVILLRFAGFSHV